MFGTSASVTDGASSIIFSPEETSESKTKPQKDIVVHQPLLGPGLAIFLTSEVPITHARLYLMT